MRAYYARCMALYGTKQEARDIALIKKLVGYEVIQFPNQGELDYRKAQGEDVMETIFKPLVIRSDIVFFRGLPDMKIPSGVAKEISWAAEAEIPVLELPTRPMHRSLSVEATREYLREIGQR